MSLVSSLFVPGGVQPATAAHPPPSATENATGIALLQFIASGHVVGFRPDEMYVAGADHALKVEFANARTVTPVQDESSPFANRTSQTPQLQSVAYPDLWDGVTLTYEQIAGAIVESTYVIAPQISNLRLPTPDRVQQIRLRYNVPVELDGSGNLLLRFQTGQLRESAPVAWQEIGGQRIPVEVAFRLLGEREVGFDVGAYDAAYPLVIDPVLNWNTFLGGTHVDMAHGIAVDGGDVYVTGESYATWGPPLNPYAGQTDAFVAKLNASDGVRQWNTFMGSAYSDNGYGIAVDGTGDVYVAGKSSAAWGTPVNPYAGYGDAFVAKLNGSDGVRQWHTFMGGGQQSGDSDEGRAIAVAGSDVYVAGYSRSTWGTPINAHTGGRTPMRLWPNSAPRQRRLVSPSPVTPAACPTDRTRSPRPSTRSRPHCRSPTSGRLRGSLMWRMRGAERAT